MEKLVAPRSFREQIEQCPSLPDAFHEVRQADGTLRPAWQRFLGSLSGRTGGEMLRRWQQCQNIIRENGFASGAHFEDADDRRPWELDAVPVLIGHDEWEHVAAALRQRMRLLEMVLRDLYGRQRLLAESVLPPELLFANPSLWRAFVNEQPPARNFLQLYAADLARAPDGQWWLLADRCEAPSGLGYALENRVVLSRMFASEFRDCQVQRLAPFFKTLQETLHSLSPRPRENPRVAILSQGPVSDNYFEDAFLARYLGYTLVEGDDLTVRNRKLFLKTLGGLLPIDVLMRRVTSAACDPLELDPRSQTGVVGLLQVERSNHVAVCNQLGSGLIESPAFMAYMPRLCEFLLGEPLALPGVATWWCGDERSRAYVLEHLDELTIKRAFRRRGQERAITRQLRDLPVSRLRERILAEPYFFVAQERVERSSVPLWTGSQTQAAHLALRGYVTASEHDYVVLPGGLARTSHSSSSLETSVLDGEGSKDTWVLSNEPVPHVTLLPRSEGPLELRRSGADLPSRVADDVFWLGRYVERADAAVRLLRTVALRLTSESDYHGLPDLPFLLRALAAQGQIEPGFAVEGIRDQLPEIHDMLPRAVMDRAEATSLRSLFDSTVRIAGKVRDRLSIDCWRILVNMEQRFADARRPRDVTELLKLANDLVLDLAAFSGTIMESTTRSQAFRFLEIGRRLERAIQLGELFETCFFGNAPIPSELLEAVLELNDSLMTYRSRYLANLQLSAVLDLVMTDETNPRSLAYQLAELATNVRQLPRRDSLPGRTRDERLAMSMLHDIRMIDIEAVSEMRSFGDGRPLERLQLSLSRQLPLLSIAISHRYLVHAGPTRQLSEMAPDDVEPL